jgi:hypothetical protein
MAEYLEGKRNYIDAISQLALTQGYGKRHA